MLLVLFLNTATLKKKKEQGKKNLKSNVIILCFKFSMFTSLKLLSFHPSVHKFP